MSSTRIEYGTSDGTYRANRDAVVSKFEATGDTDHGLDDYLPPLEIPGHGERSASCGDDIPRFCADCGATHTVGRCCRKSECPRCWKTWDRELAASVTAKLEAWRAYQEASGPPGWSGWKHHHLAISPPDGYCLDSPDPLGDTFDLLKEVLGELGAETGWIAYHPWRGEDGDDRGFWKGLLPEGEETHFSETREELSFQPHFHAVVVAKHIDTEFVTEAVEEQTGWVINRITKGGDDSESNVSVYDRYDLARTVTYTLSHAGVGERVATRWYGDIANFSASEKHERKMDAAVRSVAPNTLGLAYDSVACTVEREQTETKTVMVEKVNLGAAHGDGAGGESLEEIEVEEEVVAKCEGRMLEIRNAPAFLGDEEWVEQADHADQLEAAWESWREEIDGEPDWGPPD